MEKMRIDLPPGYRLTDVISFHGRDQESVAEQAAPTARGARLRKGVVLGGVPVLLDVDIGAKRASCTIDAAAPLDEAAQAMVRDALNNILGLHIDPVAFAGYVRNDPLLAPLAARHAGLRIIQSATVFEALTWAIIGQQINLPFAISLRRTFILEAGRRHPRGMWCYPEGADVAALEVEQLTSRKFSRSKAETLLRVARLVADGDLVLDRSADIGTTCAALLAVKGIGPWTVNYALLRGFGYPDCSLEGDVAVRTALQRLLGAAEKPSIPETAQWLAQYAPHRTMVAAHLWASL